MVLLGFIDEPKGGKATDDDPSNWTISRIGGEAAFPSDQTSGQLKSILICPKCQLAQIFVCQLYCPLEGHQYDRAIYLFACRNPSCWNNSQSWSAVRCQKFDDSVEVQEESPAVVPSASAATSGDWCDDADAWEDDDDGDQGEPTTKPSLPKKKEPEVMLEAMKLNDDQEKSSTDDDDEDEEMESKTKNKAKPVSVASSDAFAEWKRRHLHSNLKDFQTFPFYYIDVDDEETIVNEAKTREMKKLKSQMKKLEQIDEDADDLDESGSKRPKEKYEKTPNIEHGDVIFYRFQQKIRYAPDQIIRYDWSGQPLILRKTEAKELEAVQQCRYCQSRCHFEFQLMPALVNYLKIEGDVALEFGTVFVYTCSKMCWQDNKDLFRLENIFVQTDPDQNLFE